MCAYVCMFVCAYVCMFVVFCSPSRMLSYDFLTKLWNEVAVFVKQINKLILNN